MKKIYKNILKLFLVLIIGFSVCTMFSNVKASEEENISNSIVVIEFEEKDDRPTSNETEEMEFQEKKEEEEKDNRSFFRKIIDAVKKVINKVIDSFKKIWKK